MSGTPTTNDLNIEGMSDADAVDGIGCLIDAAFDAGSAAMTNRAFALLDQLHNRNLEPARAAYVQYLYANAWENRRLERGQETSWDWEQPETEAQILALRRAVTHEGFALLHKVRRCQILTNLANQLNTIGRFVEAIEYWDRALELNLKFGMALGNRGRGLWSYAHALYDSGHTGRMLFAAHESFTAAEASDAFYENDSYQTARAGYKTIDDQIAQLINLDEAAEATRQGRYGLGKSKAEKQYRSWCLRSRLFINPLNDLGPLPIAARDVMGLPSITEKSHSVYPPALFGFFNQMKQEYVSARHLFYEGTHSKGVHFSDRSVLLYNTLDYPSYSLAVEKMRTAFRTAYSILDKIGYFVNEYFELMHNPKQVSFRTVWYEPKGATPRPLLSRFTSCRNWPLRGLFWVSKDLFDEDFQDCMEPDAEALNEIRNHLEHKYLQLHHDLGAFKLEERSSVGFGYRLPLEEFSAKTLRLLKLVRAALIYLSLAVHAEERLRQGQKDKPEGIVVPILLGTWDDDWKRGDL